MRVTMVMRTGLGFLLGTLVAGTAMAQCAVCSKACDCRPGACDQCAAAPAANGGETCENGEAAACGQDPADAAADDQPWTIPQPRALEKMGIKVGGWIDAGATANPASPNSKYNGPVAPNDRNEAQLNQFYLFMERALDTEKHDWDIGGRVDLLFGSDYIYGESVGWETHHNGTTRWDNSLQYGLAMPQAYAEIGHGDLSMKAGRFYTPIGYESLMPINNFFYSQNYAVRYAEPTTHTGALMTWKASDTWSLFGGACNGADRTLGDNNTVAALLGFNFTPDHKLYTFGMAMMTGGTEPGVGVQEGVRNYLSTVLNVLPEGTVNLVTQFDYGLQDDFAGAGTQAEFYSITQYLFYKINDCWKFGVRFDAFRDDDGTRLVGLRNATDPAGVPLSGGNPLTAGNVGTVEAISVGLNYQPNKNLRIRPELRWDWYDADANAPYTLLFADGTKNAQFTAAVDMIFTF